jgi:hypothetical protein
VPNWCMSQRRKECLSPKEDIPLFLIKYRELRSNEGQVVSDLIPWSSPKLTPSSSIWATSNIVPCWNFFTKRLHSKYQEKNEEDKASLASRPPSSFVLPLCPIGMHDLGSLTKDSGCEVCGKKNISRCAQCLAVSYCSECEFSNSFTKSFTHLLS